MPCTDPDCRGRLHVIRSRYYPEKRMTRRILKCDVCGRKAATREEITNANAATTYLPAPQKMEPLPAVLTTSRKRA